MKKKLGMAIIVLGRLLAQPQDPPHGYILGPDDQILIRELEAIDLLKEPVLIGTNGNVTLPLVGKIQAGGMSVEQLEGELNRLLKAFIREPKVSVTVVAFQSQPVSVFGAVTTPGVYQLRGGKTLYEVLSMAGGPRESAGASMTVTRRHEHGPIPIPGATTDPTGMFSSAEVEVHEILTGKHPAANLEIKPHDVISVSQANTSIVYVVGDVQRPGAFTIGAQRTISVLKALSLAGGLGRTARGNKVRIIRELPGKPQPQQIAVNVDRILKGKEEDVGLRPEDVLVVPTSGRKTFTTLVVPATIAAAVAAAIYTTAR